MKLVVESLRLTCGACPTQWEGVLSDGRALYVRYRYGRLLAGVGATIEDAIDATFKGQEGTRELVLDRQIGHELAGVLSFTELQGHAVELDFSPVELDFSPVWRRP